MYWDVVTKSTATEKHLHLTLLRTVVKLALPTAHRDNASQRSRFCARQSSFMYSMVGDTPTSANYDRTKKVVFLNGINRIEGIQYEMKEIVCTTSVP